MTISNKKLFIDLKYFFSGCHSLALNYEEMVDEFWKNNIVTDHGLPVCIRIPITSCFVACCLINKCYRAERIESKHCIIKNVTEAW
jgi:hypothetical protein